MPISPHIRMKLISHGAQSSSIATSIDAMACAASLPPREAAKVQGGAFYENEPRHLLSKAELSNRVYLDLWYPGPPTKGGPSHGQFAVHPHPGPPYGGAGFDQSHPGRVSAVGPAL